MLEKLRDYFSDNQDTEDRIPITKGCPNSGSPCFCTGECKKVIGYIDKEDYEDFINKHIQNI